MKILAIGVALALVLLPAMVAVAADGVTTEAARPSDLIAAPAQGMRVFAGGCPSSIGMSDELKMLLGSESYPGAPTAADLGYTGPRCEIDPGPCDGIEDEPICEAEWVDIWNGGCNSAPSLFDTLYPYYGRIALVGTSGNYTIGGGDARDTDWYEIHVTEMTDITFSCIAEFPLQIVFIDGNAGCPAVDYVVAEAEACAEASIQVTVGGAGTYWLWVGPTVYSGIPCGEEYRMTVDGYEAAGCIADCPFGALHENEETCYPEYVDSWNGGCNSEPDVFQVLDPHAETITICGEAGVYPSTGMCFRDTDWYQITLDQPREITMCAYAEFPIWLLILGGSCDAYQSFAYADAGACELACAAASLDPGTYWLWIAPGGWTPVDCGSRYTMTVSGYTTPVERTSWGTIKALYR